MYADGLLWGASRGTAGLRTQGGGDATGPNTDKCWTGQLHALGLSPFRSALPAS